jgi:hypothetical protein
MALEAFFILLFITAPLPYLVQIQKVSTGPIARNAYASQETSENLKQNIKINYSCKICSVHNLH